MKIKRFVLMLALSVALPATARADKPELPSCAFDGIGGFNWGLNVSYIACLGAFSGNTDGAGDKIFVLNQLNTAPLPWGTGWSEQDSPGFNTTTGVLTFSSFVQGPFAIALKQGPGYSLYLFNAAAPINTMFYTSGGVQDGPSTEKDLSHANLYTRVGVGGTCFGDACGSVVTPEPSTYALMAAGLAAVAFVTRRRRQIV